MTNLELVRPKTGQPPAPPFGVKFLVGFFSFGALMCWLTVVILLFPESPLSVLWQLNPQAQVAFGIMGGWALLLMTSVGAMCAATALGLARRRRWGRTLAVGVLIANSLGDLANAQFRHDYRALIGLPIAAAIIAYLSSRRVSLILPKKELQPLDTLGSKSK